MTQQVYLRIPSSETDLDNLSAASPTPTPDPSTTAASPELKFKDDFETEFQPGWEWVSDEEPHWSLSENPGYLQITLWTGYTVDRLLRQAPEGDFEILTSHLTVLRTDTKMYRDRNFAQQLSIHETETDLKDTQVTAILAIDQMAQSSSNGATADREEPDIQESHSQGQTR